MEPDFNAGKVNCNAGLFFLREFVEERLDLISKMAGSLKDWYRPRYVKH